MKPSQIKSLAKGDQGLVWEVVRRLPCTQALPVESALQRCVISLTSHRRPLCPTDFGALPFQRSVSTSAKSNIDDKWSHDLHHKNNPHASRVSQLPMRHNSA